MAIMKCPQCSKRISSQYSTCPHCSFPIRARDMNERDYEEALARAERRKRQEKLGKIDIGATVTVVAASIVFVLYFFHGNESADPKVRAYYLTALAALFFGYAGLRIWRVIIKRR